MSKTLYWNLPSSSGMLILSLAEPAVMLTTLLIYQTYNLQILPKYHTVTNYKIFTLLYHHYLSSIFQHNTYPHTYHKFISDRFWRISYLPTSPTGIPHQTLLNYYSPHIARKLRMPLETLQQTTCQDATVHQVPGSTSLSPYPTIIYASTRIVQHPGHLPLQWNNYNICH